MVSGIIHILHTAPDAKVAEALAEALRPRGLETVLAMRGAMPGAPAAFGAADTVVLLFSRQAAVSGGIGFDLVQAQRAGIPVVALRTEAVEPDGAFDALLGDRPMIDLFAGWNQGLGALILALRDRDAATYRGDPAFEATTPGFERGFVRRARRGASRKRLRGIAGKVVLGAMLVAIPVILAVRLGMFDPAPLPGLPLSGGILAQPNAAVLEMGDKGNEAYERKDYVEAAKWYRLAAGGNDPGAQTNLGRLYMYGQGVPRDDNQAMVWYRTAAIQGYPRAMNNIGTMYALGRGTAVDFGEALRWFHAAAERGHAQANYNIGVAYELGGGVTQSFTEAKDWYNRAADRGHGPAFTALAALFDNGRGVRQDHKEALRLYIEGAERHDVTAMLALADIYAGGEGVEHNLDQTLFWTRKAAEDGSVEAMFRIGAVDAANEADAERAEQGRIMIRRAAEAGHAGARAWMAEH